MSFETILWIAFTAGAAESGPAATDGVVINDPVHIADGVELSESEIGPNVTLGKGSSVRGSRLRDTIVGANSRVVRCDLHDSLVGNDVELAGVKGQVDVGDHSTVQLDD